MCNNCSKKYFESTHATIIKQVYKHHYSNSNWEEKIRINDNCYEIDIINHIRKEAIEIDGEQHNKITNFHVRKAKKYKTTPEFEFEQQKIRDERVNNYFKNIGYNLIRINAYDKSPLEALKEIFPQYNSIPNWIDFTGRTTNYSWDIQKAQELINNNINLSEIAKSFNIHPSSLTQAINYGHLIIPDYFERKNRRNWDLSKAQQLLDEGKTYKEIEEIMKLKPRSIQTAIYYKKLTK